MTVDQLMSRGDGISLWRQIAQHIRADIRGHVLRPGDRLPTEWDLTHRFGVNRHTVRRALAALAEDGVVRAEQGRGTFVQEGVMAYPISRRTRFSEAVRKHGRRPQSELLNVKIDHADARIASALRVKVATPVWVIEIVRRADGQAVSIATHFFDKRRFPRVVDVFRETGSISAALADAGIDEFTRTRTQVSSRLPTPDETRILQMLKTRPLLVMESVDVDRDGKPVEFGIARFPADRVELVLQP